MDKLLVASISKTLVLFLTSVFVHHAPAQGASVVESQAITLGNERERAPDRPPQSNNNDALSLLLEQNQQLRAELQALRGLVEEQGFEIRKMQRDSLNRYTNVDDRLSGLELGGGLNTLVRNPDRIEPSESEEPPLTTPTQDINNNGLNELILTPQETGMVSELARTSRGTLRPAVLSEQQLYQMAYDSVINSNFERAIAEFDQYMNIYPEGRFVTNAYYWKGQAYLYLNRYMEAKDSYEVILNEFEDSAKLPDAMYGLGLSYQGLENITQARQLFNEIKRRYPNTGVANLADTKLLQLD
ncbi:tol-pal system protein YbgF [Gammaproteobacteria bacterium]|nr:tol-pal system protein YbgF [Gammaproteobacteria bacterium]